MHMSKQSVEARSLTGVAHPSSVFIEPRREIQAKDCCESTRVLDRQRRQNLMLDFPDLVTRQSGPPARFILAETATDTRFENGSGVLATDPSSTLGAYAGEPFVGRHSQSVGRRA